MNIRFHLDKRQPIPAMDRTLRISKADAHVEAGWRDNYLIFESTPLIDVIAQIEAMVWGGNQIAS